MTAELIPLHDDEIDQQILKQRVAGLSVLEIAKQMGMSRHQVLAALDRNLPQIDAAFRRRQIGLSLLRLDELSETFLKQARTGDVELGSLCIRIECERRALLGLTGTGYDPIQLAAASNAGDRQRSIDAYKRAFAHVLGKRSPECPTESGTSEARNEPPKSDPERSR